MQKIAVFGGTGMTGQCAVRHALARNLKVRLLIRDEATVPEDFKEKVELVKGNVLNLSDCKATVAGVDAVVVVLGTRNDLKATTDLSEGMKNIIAAMKEANLKKVSVCLSAFLFYEPEKVPKIFTELNADHQREFDAVKASDLDYRCVLPPHIADEPSAEFEVMHDKSPGRSISKLDLGKFLVDCLEQEEHSRKTIGLATKK
ncbi:flavin reductase (NADPH) [Culicoides brevitarsis]|uniref:flavin reductase (NADPH) n=1 Tax=Culicoides brevitarsis TaxID=469753 RepID=UPI00307BD9C1